MSSARRDHEEINGDSSESDSIDHHCDVVYERFIKDRLWASRECYEIRPRMLHFE